jgi:hypothetical protein
MPRMMKEYTLNRPARNLQEIQLEHLNMVMDLGHAKFDTGDEEERKEFLDGLITAATQVKFMPNAMMAIHDYFEPGFDALAPEPPPQISPFTGGPRPGGIRLDIPLPMQRGATGDAPGKSPVSQPPAPALPPVGIPLGTFTVEHADGSYETVKIHQAGPGSNLAGKIMGSHINGPDNETSYQAFCFIDEHTGMIHVWSRFAHIDERWVKAIDHVIHMDAEGRAEGREAYAMRSGRCSKCGRKLTVPASLHRGMGPECASGW